MLRAEKAVDRRILGDLGGVDATIYSAMASEAFPNDFAHVASILNEDNTPEITAAAQILSELEEQHAQTKTKYQVLYYLLAKTPLPRDVALWDDFDLLIRLRNELVHPKPETFEFGDLDQRGRWVKLVKRLDQRGLISRPLNAAPSEWSFFLEDDEKVAAWALKTAKSMIQWVASVAPPCKFRETFLERFIRPDYLDSRLWGN